MRLRQIALVGADLDRIAGDITAVLGLGAAYADPGVGKYGLRNQVWPIGDTFLEVVSPKAAGTTAGRLLDKRGGDGGYMAIFQTDDLAAARARIAAEGVRVVDQIDRDGAAFTHLHPKDVPGAIVSVDTPLPPETWRWGGPDWTGQAPVHHDGGIRGITVDCDDPDAAATTWGSLVGLTPDNRTIALDDGRQCITFRPTGARGEAITELVVAIPGGGSRLELCGLSLQVVDT